jgi:hypothetical protein
VRSHDKRTQYEHRSILVIDVEDSSSRLDPDLMTLRRALYEVVEDALDRSSIAPECWVREDRGDGILLLVDSTVPKIKIADEFLYHLSTSLLAHNQNNDLEKWMRLRTALHAGEVQRDSNGWGSAALTLTFRLAEAKTVKKMFAAASRAQSVVVVSDHLYQGVIRHGHGAIDAASYREVEVPVGADTVRAWVRMPGYAKPPGTTATTEPSAASLAAVLLAQMGRRTDDKTVATLRSKYASFTKVVHERFQSDPEAQTALGAAEWNPGDTDAIARLTAVLRRHATQDSLLNDKMERLAAEIATSDAAPRNAAAQQMARNIFNGEITVRRDFNNY